MNIKFPSAGDSDPKRRAMGTWLANIRKLYREGKLEKFKIKMFEQIPGWVWDDPRFNKMLENKKKLLEMAQNNEPRPHSRKHPLGSVFNNYIGKHNDAYDPEFTKEIRKLATRWFVDTTSENKKKLLEIARNNKPRPSQRKHPFGIVFCKYTNKNHACYDPKFTKEIKKLAPRWFINTAIEKKKQLLEMARNGEPRPNKKKHPLGQALVHYTNKKSRCYDPQFDQQIRKLAPHWFVNTAIENKKQLLEMAKAGEPRPHWKGKLSQNLASYINKGHNSYDPQFDQKIKKLTPHWFNKVA